MSILYTSKRILSLPNNTTVVYNYRMSKITSKQIILSILGFALANFIAGYGVVLLGVDVPGIYAGLAKPYFAPPTSIFGVVWTFNTILFIYGFLITINSPSSRIRTTLMRIDYLLIFNYVIFQYLSFGSGVLFGRIIPAMFFIPTFSMLLLTIFASIYAYRLDTKDTGILTKIRSGKSVFASLTPLLSWILIASALGLGIWIMN
jgi:tryptophan-rich sensory protein